MKSGRGSSFAKTGGTVAKNELEKIHKDLRGKYSERVALYKYTNNAECILVYGDGRVMIDPYPTAPNHQLNIGNILSDAPDKIISNFLKDPENYKGYCRHLTQT